MKKLKANDLPFSKWVVQKALMVPLGRVTTYGRIARAAGGGAMAAQSVTAILGKAEERGVTGIPFHRIVYADGRAWMDERYRREREALYRKEGIGLDERGHVLNFRKILFEY